MREPVASAGVFCVSGVDHASPDLSKHKAGSGGRLKDIGYCAVQPRLRASPHQGLQNQFDRKAIMGSIRDALQAGM